MTLSDIMRFVRRQPLPFEKTTYDGICIGVDDRGRTAWLTDSLARQHLLVLGTTGSGKTEFQLSILEGAMRQGRGGVFVDGKGDPAIISRVKHMAAAMGRSDDVLVLDFASPSSGSSGTNTFNPFAFGQANMLTAAVVDMLEDDGGGDHRMWKSRAAALVSAVVGALVWQRDCDGMHLDARVVMDHLSIEALMDLVDVDRHPEMPKEIRSAVLSYLSSLPGFQLSKGYKQAQTTLDQHGFLHMQFTRMFGLLVHVYPHIFCDGAGEIDMRDVFRTDRILVVSLPALEKSSDEIVSLGRLVVGSLKTMMAEVFSPRMTSTWEDAVEFRPVRREAPFPIILDEVGYYANESLGLLCAQSRALGFSLVFSAHDVASLGIAGPIGAQAILGNTNTKIMMAQPPGTTSILMDARDTSGAVLKSLKPGEFVAVSGSSSRRLRTFMTERPDPNASSRCEVVLTDIRAAAIELIEDVVEDEQRSKLPCGPRGVTLSDLHPALARLVKNVDGGISPDRGDALMKAALKAIVPIVEEEETAFDLATAAEIRR